MIKSSIIHSIHVMIRNTLLVLIVIALALFFWLRAGISIDTLEMGDYRVEKLYIKLDKKLTLKAAHVAIPQSKTSPSFVTLDKTFDRIKYLLSFFEYIELDEIDFSNNRIDLIYGDDVLYITTDDYVIAGNIQREGRLLNAQISMLYLKKHHLTLSGDLSYDLRNHFLVTQGHFRGYGIDGRFSATKEKQRIAFTLAADPFDNLKPVIDIFKKMHPTVKSWILERIQGKRYTLYELSGEGSIDQAGSFTLDMESLRGEALIEDVRIYFQKGLDPIHAKRLFIHHKEGALFFDLQEPRYKQIDLEGSKIAITGLIRHQALLRLDLKLKAPVDRDVHRILNAYSIHLPIRYTGNYASVKLKIDVPLKKRQKKKKRKIKVFVHVDLKKGRASYQNITLPIQRGWVEYHNQKQDALRADILLDKGKVVIGKTVLPVSGGEVKYRENHISLKQVNLKEKWFDMLLDGDIDLSRKKAKLTAWIKKLQIGTERKIVSLRDKKLPFTINFAKVPTLEIPALGIQIKKSEAGTLIFVSSLKKVKPYLRDVGIGFEDGTLTIKMKDMQHYQLEGSLKSKACFFYGKNNSCYGQIPFTAEISAGKVAIDAFGKKLHYDPNKERIDLKEINIDLKKLLENDLETDQKEKKNTQGRLSRKGLLVIGKKSTIRYDSHALVLDSYDITLKPNGDITAIGSSEGNIVKFDKKDHTFTLKALRVTDRLLHPLIDFKGLHGGRYSVSMQGDPDREMKGRIIVEGGVMSDFKAYNNTLAFVNTLPALATLQNPGFSKQGFKIKEGVIEYRQRKQKILFDSIYIKGASATIVGKGSLDLQKNTIHIDLAIRTARELGRILGNLPLLGYIITGKDKSITVGLKIRGTIDQPKVQISAAREILSLPLEIIKRTLESPAHIINK
jgi:hypothetical protein